MGCNDPMAMADLRADGGVMFGAQGKCCALLQDVGRGAVASSGWPESVLEGTVTRSFREEIRVSNNDFALQKSVRL